MMMELGLALGVLQSPKATNLFPEKAIAPPKMVALTWKIPPGEPSCVCNVWQTRTIMQTNVFPIYDPGSTNKPQDQWIVIGYGTNVIDKIGPWERIATTTNDFLKAIPMTNNMAFFFTTLSNTVTHLESPLPHL